MQVKENIEMPTAEVSLESKATDEKREGIL